MSTLIKKYKLKIKWADSYNDVDDYTVTESTKRAIINAHADRPLDFETETGSFKIFDPKAQIKRMIFTEIKPEVFRADIAPVMEELQLPAKVTSPADLKPEVTNTLPVLSSQTKFVAPIVLKDCLEKIKKSLNEGKPEAAILFLEHKDMAPKLQMIEPVMYSLLLIEAYIKLGRIDDARIVLAELKTAHRVYESPTKARLERELEAAAAAKVSVQTKIITPVPSTVPSK